MPSVDDGFTTVMEMKSLSLSFTNPIYFSTPLGHHYMQMAGKNSWMLRRGVGGTPFPSYMGILAVQRPAGDTPSTADIMKTSGCFSQRIVLCWQLLSHVPLVLRV